MQIPSNNPDSFIKSMTEKCEEIRTLFLEHVKTVTKTKPLKVMLGDGTVLDQESFDPTLVRQFYDRIIRNLSSWKSEGISNSTDQDLRRVFIKFETKEDNYALSCHMSLQYHALLFYKLDHRIIEIQKELSEIIDKIKGLEGQTAPESDKIIQEMLKKKGFENMDHQKLFEVLFEHNDLTQELLKSLSSQSEITHLITKRDDLFKELDNMLIEIYHTTPVLIDEIRMIGAEEGCLCNFNLEYSKNNSRDGNITPSRISNKTKESLQKKINDVIEVLKI